GISRCIIYGTICWLYLHGIIPPGFGIFFATTTIWAVQIQCVLQIICNRVGVLLPDDRSRLTLKLSVAFFVLLINISVYCIWIPSKMGVDEKFKQINVVWDRVEKVIYLFIDMALNAYFIISVKRRLVAYGLRKYDALVRYNTWIATVSVSMDVFIICMMSLKNDFVYNQVHPVAYMVKLNIEISMSDLIRRVATSTGTAQLDSQSTPDCGGSASLDLVAYHFVRRHSCRLRECQQQRHWYQRAARYAVDGRQRRALFHEPGGGADRHGGRDRYDTP
ncbi:hypothetical protein K525DRAFT_199444, partial [Schizophyllum commune Loenen D]